MNSATLFVLTAQPHLLRLFGLIRLLADRPGHTVAQVARRLDTTTRTIYRYLETLQEIGYLIDSDPQTNQYFFFEANRTNRPAFTAQESALVVRLLATQPTDDPLTHSIRRKLYLTSELVPLADELQERHQGMLVERLNTALTDGRQVQLLRYHSLNSNTIADRLVEPLGFTDNYATLKAYDVAAGREKSFKIRRMTDVQVLTTPVQVSADPAEVLDAFDWPGPEPLPVVLNMTLLAWQLLREDHTRCRPFLHTRDHPTFPYQFRGEVRNYTGLGRFVLGLPGEIEVVEPEAFRVYLRERAGLAGWCDTK